ncbi:hypothetical protein Y032_0042g667 [Ancylostoma ceylanicum]|uniref:Uncharacterized protein n=1 Tax=Ancylostoma ceylanicum TaxID=53326 RepID=A0A016UGL4_9BILA|nr:hypothetical protein Y032_0042g667 [Ancylostoma ceylanicum]
MGSLVFIEIMPLVKTVHISVKLGKNNAVHSTGSRCRWRDHELIRGHSQSISSMVNRAQPRSLSSLRECTSTFSFLNALYSLARVTAHEVVHVFSAAVILRVIMACLKAETFTPIENDCNLLKENCLALATNNGYCYMYRRNCPRNDDVETKLARKINEKHFKDCRRWKQKCGEKYPKHHACIQFKKKCNSLNITALADTMGGSSSSEENRSDQRHKQAGFCQFQSICPMFHS